MMDTDDISRVFREFDVAESFLEASPVGSGHIHATWRIKTEGKESPGYILQKINHRVFPPVHEMMDNIQKVTRHIAEKHRNDSEAKVPVVIPTCGGNHHYLDSMGQYWRMYRFIPPGLTYDVTPDLPVAREAGTAFGRFLSDLSDLSPSEIFPVIPDFHSIQWRWDQFKRACAADTAGRLAGVSAEYDFACSQIERLGVIAGLEQSGTLPVRITHNDTKLNNVVFNDRGKAICVIDLDTVMPGLVLYDFGDAIRTTANTTAEDENDLEQIHFDLDIFRAFTSGYLKETEKHLLPAEIEYLPLSCQYMTFIMGLRFLTDYLSGDVYYHIRYPDQNIRRCKAQFRLMQNMMRQEEHCRKIIGFCSGNEC